MNPFTRKNFWWCWKAETIWQLMLPQKNTREFIWSNFVKENKNHIKRAATQWETWITKLPKWSGFNPSEFPIERRKIEFCIFNIFPPPPLARQMMFGIYAAAYTERRRFVWICNEYRRSSLLNNYFPWKASRLFQHQNEKKLFFIGSPLQIKR